MKIRSILSPLSFIAVALVWCVQVASARQETEKPPQEKSEMLVARVLVLDPDGNPLEGATVTPSGLRTKVEPGSHWGWNKDYHGPEPRVATSADGIAKVPFPKYVMEKLETGTMTWTVEHPEFVNFREDRSVSDDPAEIRLKRGFKIAVTAVDGGSGKPLPDATVAMWPNQYWFRQGSQILGTQFRFADWLAKISRGDLERNRENRYSATTDSGGVATIRNLPIQ